MKVILNVFVWNIEHANGDIIVSQKDYIQSKVEKLDIEGDSMTTDQTPSDKTSGVGKTRWLSDQTKPDIAYTAVATKIRTHLSVVIRVLSSSVSISPTTHHHHHPGNFFVPNER